MPGVKKYNLVNVKVFDGNQFVNGHVIINGPVIGENKDAAGSEPVNCGGGYLIPGFIDCHVHLYPDHPECMYEMRDYGITSAMDMETWPLDKLNALRSLPGVPYVKSAGLAAQYNRLGQWPPESKIETPDEAHTFVAHRASEGLDFIKMISDPPPPTPITPPGTRGLDLATMTELCVSADQHEMLTIAHAVEGVGFTMSLKAGVKLITHTPLVKGLDGGAAELNAIAQMAALKRISVPTLIMMQMTAANMVPPIPGASIQNAIDSVKQMHTLGVPILAGTDCNPGDDPNAPAAPKYGSGLHDEMALLKQCNMSNLEVLRSATVLPPQYFGMPDRGVIAPGYTSDLVLLTADPTVDIANTRKIAKIWVKGEMFAPGDR
jgi:imidazolonepropionase-like amidohydrolase